MRVALVSDWFLPRLGGIELQVDDLRRELAKAGHFVRLFTSTPANGCDDDAVLRLDTLLGRTGAPAFSPRLARVLEKKLANGFDVLHAHVSVVSPLAYSAVIAARRLGLPTVVSFHSVLRGKRVLLRLLESLVGFSGWPLIACGVSEPVAAQLRRVSGNLDVGVLRNGVHVDAWPTRRTERQATGIAVVSAMRLNRKKRPMALLSAFRHACARAEASGIRTTLTVAGDGPLRRQVERYVRRHFADGQVRLLGAVPRAALPALYGQSDIFVLPSLRESFGLAALEARCARLAVVAMRETGASDFLSHGQTGLLATGDVELSDHILRLAADDALRSRLAAADPALRRYDWPRVIEECIATYGRAVDKARS